MTDADDVFSNSWPSSAAEQHPPVLKPDLVLTAMGTPNHGNVDLQVDLLLGALETTTATTTMVGIGVAEAEVAEVVLHPGLATDGSGIMTTMEVTATMAVRTMATARLRPARRLGSKPLVLKPGTVALLHPELRPGNRLLALRPRTAVIRAAMARLQASEHRLHRLLIISRR